MKQIILTLAIYCFIPNLGFSQQKQSGHTMKTALILIDIQNDYFDKGAMSLVSSDKAVISPLPRVFNAWEVESKSLD